MLIRQESNKATFKLQGETKPVLEQQSAITSPFGYTTNPFSKEVALHTGVDLRGPVGLAIHAPAGADPSHPAFYLPGQEEGSGNVRAFAALEPCKENGNQCSSGVECCCGGCSDTGQCVCPGECSKFDEKCDTAADCCSPQAQCINGFCAFIPPA